MMLACMKPQDIRVHWTRRDCYFQHLTIGIRGLEKKDNGRATCASVVCQLKATSEPL